METLKALLRAALRPWEAFPARVLEAPSLGPALVRMLLWRSPLAFLGGWLALVQYRNLQAGMLDGRLPVSGFPVDPALIREMATQLPAPPDTAPFLAALLLLAPLSVLSLWLHHAVWDHGALWLMGCRGLRFRVSASADADAVLVGSVGAALALLGDIPGLGWILAPLLMPLGLWFWGMRGFALAAWHGLPVWKGILATVVHAASAVVLFILMLVLAWLMAMQLAGV